MIASLRPEFLEFIPNEIESGVLYISRDYATAVHQCCCGCGARVVTPLSTTGWRLDEDGDSVSLDPSIGNWSFPCQSHYWIRRNRVEWSYAMSRKEIEDGRSYEARARERYFAAEDQTTSSSKAENSTQGRDRGSREGLFARLRKWLFG